MPALTAAAAARPATTAPPAAAPLDLDERLRLAVLAVDAAIDTEPLDLDDVIRAPEALSEALWAPAPAHRPTPVAALLQRAAHRLQTGGWCRGATVDDQGARCLYGAIRAADPGGAHTDDALAVLLTALRREFGPDVDTVPQANDHLLRDREHAVRILGAAADLADARGL